MVTLEVKFQCEKCGTYLMRPVAVGKSLWIVPSHLPEGWKIKMDGDLFFTYCPIHSKEV
jgi:hypothetical protein